MKRFKPEPMRIVSVRLPVWLIEKLERLSIDQKMTVSDLIRAALESYAQQGKP